MFACRSPRQLFYYTRFIEVCQELFSNSFELFWISCVPLISGNSFSLTHSQPFVNTFFSIPRSFVSYASVVNRVSHEWIYLTISHSVCQHLFSFSTFSPVLHHFFCLFRACFNLYSLFFDKKGSLESQTAFFTILLFSVQKCTWAGISRRARTSTGWRAYASPLLLRHSKQHTR